MDDFSSTANFPQTFDEWLNIIEQIENSEKDSQDFQHEKLKLLMYAGNYLMSLNKLDDSKKAFNHALSIAQKNNDLKNIAEILSALAQIYYFEDDLENAEQFLLQALNLYINEFGQNSKQVVDTYNNLAIIAQKAGNAQKAIDYMLKHIEKIKQVGNIEPEYLATSFNNLAGVYLTIGQLQKALEYLRKAQIILENLPDKNLKVLADIFNNQAIINSKLNHYDLALIFHKKAIDTYEQLTKKDDYSLATAYTNYANTLFETGKTIEAIKFLDKSIEILSKILGDQHPEVKELKQTKEKWIRKL